MLNYVHFLCADILVTSFFATARNVTAEAPQSSVGGREAILSGNTELEITRGNH